MATQIINQKGVNKSINFLYNDDILYHHDKITYQYMSEWAFSSQKVGHFPQKPMKTEF